MITMYTMYARDEGGNDLGLKLDTPAALKA
jgi:hypothetical protein